MQLEMSEWNSEAPVAAVLQKKFLWAGFKLCTYSKGVYDHVFLSVYKYQIKRISELI